jgi:hypothetical protein
MDGRTRSTIERRCGDCCSSARRSCSTVARMAPQLEWPRTTTSDVLNRSTANSTLPICDGATMLPATRMTKRSPRPWSKTISAGTRESEQPRIIAKGSCCWMRAARRARFARDPIDATPATKRRLPSFNLRRASCGEIATMFQGSITEKINRA